MNLLLLKKRRERRSKAQLVDGYMRASHCVVKLLGQPPAPGGLIVEFHGELAAIPNIKNATLPQGGLRTSCEAKLIAMTALYQRAVADQAIYYKDEMLSVAVICAERGTDFDPIGVGETVQDFLEPGTKVVGRKSPRHRGWGVGITEDDKFITSYSVRSRMVGPECEYTRIIIRPWALVWGPACQFIAAHYLGG